MLTPTSKGMSREGTVRSPSAMSNASNTGVQVRLRQPGIQRKPRPTSIAVSGMSQSMYDKRNPSAASTPSSFRGPPRCENPLYMYCTTTTQFLLLSNKSYRVTNKGSTFKYTLGYYMFKIKRYINI